MRAFVVVQATLKACKLPTGTRNNVCEKMTLIAAYASNVTDKLATISMLSCEAFLFSVLLYAKCSPFGTLRTWKIESTSCVLRKHINVSRNRKPFSFKWMYFLNFHEWSRLKVAYLERYKLPWCFRAHSRERAFQLSLKGTIMSGNALRLLLFSAQTDGHKYVYVTHSQTAGFKLSSHSQRGNKQNKGSPSFASHVEKGTAGFCAGYGTFGSPGGAWRAKSVPIVLYALQLGAKIEAIVERNGHSWHRPEQFCLFSRLTCLAMNGSVYFLNELAFF